MTRGKQKLYLDLIRPTQEQETDRKRNHLMPERNRALACRYYYHLFVRRRRYEDALADLTCEFFICETTIVNLLSKPASMQLLEELTDTQPGIRDFQSQYPQWSWKMKAAA